MVRMSSTHDTTSADEPQYAIPRRDRVIGRVGQLRRGAIAGIARSVSVPDSRRLSADQSAAVAAAPFGAFVLEVLPAVLPLDVLSHAPRASAPMPAPARSAGMSVAPPRDAMCHDVHSRPKVTAWMLRGRNPDQPSEPARPRSS